MSLPILVRASAEKKVAEFCQRRVPESALHQVNLSYKFVGNIVTIFENRAPWRKELKEWTSSPIAKMKYDEKSEKWTLYYFIRNRWYKYDYIEPTEKKNFWKRLIKTQRTSSGANA